MLQKYYIGGKLDWKPRFFLKYYDPDNFEGEKRIVGVGFEMYKRGWILFFQYDDWSENISG